MSVGAILICLGIVLNLCFAIINMVILDNTWALSKIERDMLFLRVLRLRNSLREQNIEMNKASYHFTCAMDDLKFLLTNLKLSVKDESGN